MRCGIGWTKLEKRFKLHGSVPRLKLLSMLQSRAYKFRDIKDDSRTHLGFVAQEIKWAFESSGYKPEEIGICATHKAGTLGLRYPQITAINTQAIIEQQREIDELKAAKHETQRWRDELEKRLERLERP